MTEQRTYSGREAILALNDLDTTEVYIAAWDTWVRVKAMSAGQQAKLAALTVTSSKGELDVDVSQLAGVMAQVAAWCLVDDNGARLFSDRDVEALNGKAGSALQTIFDAAMRVSGMGDADATETIAKN